MWGSQHGSILFWTTLQQVNFFPVYIWNVFRYDYMEGLQIHWTKIIITILCKYCKTLGSLLLRKKSSFGHVRLLWCFPSSLCQISVNHKACKNNQINARISANCFKRHVNKNVACLSSTKRNLHT